MTLAATGLVFGFWPLLLGGGIAVLAAGGWQAAVNREQRHGRLEHPGRTSGTGTGPGAEGRMGPSDGTRVLGLLADPELPTELATTLAGDLPRLLREQADDRVAWEVKVVCEPFAAAVDQARLLAVARQRRRHEGWDLAICLTDLPFRGGRRPLVLVAGKVRANRPWRLMLGLSSALAAALATSAFGLTQDTLWQLADALDPWRLLVAALGSVATLVLWLITDHELWERRKGPAARQGLPIGLYNAATVLTVTLGVTVREHALLAWVTTSAAVVGGALGSGLESDEAVRGAAYGNREAERRRQDAGPGHQER